MFEISLAFAHLPQPHQYWQWETEAPLLTLSSVYCNSANSTNKFFLEPGPRHKCSSSEVQRKYPLTPFDFSFINTHYLPFLASISKLCTCLATSSSSHPALRCRGSQLQIRFAQHIVLKYFTPFIVARTSNWRQSSTTQYRRPLLSNYQNYAPLSWEQLLRPTCEW